MADSEYVPGTQVRIVSARHRVGVVVGRPQHRQGQPWYSVFFRGSETEVFPHEDLEPFSGASDVRSLLLDGRFGGRESLSRLITQLKLSLDLRSQIYALSASTTEFLPYQFKPLLKFFDSRNHRLLIADEVGLGKTIEAGLILTELRHRKPDLSRVLVVVPSHLCRKWQAEMRRRFSLHFDILDSGRLRQFLTDYDREGPDTSLRAIVSLQTLSRAPMMEAWEAVAPDIDLAIFDEAGRLRNDTTNAHQLARLLGESSDALLLLTATPVQTKTKDLFNLLRLLDPTEFARFDVFEEQLASNAHVLAAQSRLRKNADLATVLPKLRQVESSSLASRFLDNPLYTDVVQRLRSPVTPSRRERIQLQRDLEALTVFGHVLSRTRKRDVDDSQPKREAHIYPCRSVSSSEMEFYWKVTQLCREAYGRRHPGSGASFGIIQSQRQMASCMVAMIDYIRQRTAEAEHAPIIDLDDSTVDVAATSAVRLDWTALGDFDTWSHRLRAHDSKLEALCGVLRAFHQREPGAKVIVFTHFPRTAHYLCRQLHDRGIRAKAITGHTPTNALHPERDERLRLISSFRSDPDFVVLIATNVAEEGLDLQFVHCMVNYDLPWNPMRIEQRIGRIDRIGQKSDVVQIINLSMPGTIEDRMLTLLFERLRIFERSIGDLETIMGNVIDRLERVLFEPGLSVANEREEIERAANAIMYRVQVEKEIEPAVEALIGGDEFFTHEARQAKQTGRYPTGEELVVYLRDYITEQHSDSRLAPEGVHGQTFSLDLGDSLRQAVRRTAPQGDNELRHFLAQAATGRCTLTTNPTVAETNPHIMLLTFYHPLIRTVCQHYADHLPELHPVCYVQLRSTEFPEGPYAWLLYSSEIHDSRRLRDLELVAVHLQHGRVLPEDVSDTLLWSMVSRATTVPETRRHIRVDAALLARAESEFLTRLDARFSARRRLSEALLANRLASLRETYERNRAARMQRLREAIEKRRRPAYIKGLKTRITTLEAGYKDKVSEIESTRGMARSYSLRAGGVMEIANAMG